MPSPRAIYLAAFKACLERITKANGFQTDAGKLFSLEPAPALAEDEAAFITAVWSRQAVPTNPARLRTSRLTTVDVVAKLPSTYANAQEIVDLVVEDIEAAFAGQHARFPVGYDFPQYQSAVPLPAAAAAGFCGVVVTYAGHIPIR